jgi:hypothetical protein
MFKTAHFQFHYDHYQIDLDNPAPSLREDLRFIRLAEKLGWIIKEGRSFAEPIQFMFHRNPPLNRLSVWSTWKGWACAELDNGGYINHRYYGNLKDALETESKSG